MRKILFALVAALLFPIYSMVPAVAANDLILGTVVTSCGTPPSTYSAGQSRPATLDTTGVICTSASSGGGGNVTITSPLDGAGSVSVDPTDSGGTTMTRTSDHSLNVNVTNNGVVAGTTTTGATYAATACATTTSAPTYTTAQLNPCSSTTAGGQRSDISSVNGTTVLTGTGAQGAGSQRVTVATDSATVAGSASLPAGSNLIGKAGIDQTTPGTTNNVTVSTNVGTLPLIQATASVPITFTAAGGPTQIIAASGSTKVYITHWDVVLSGAGTIALVTGTGTNCGTGTAYLTGAASHPLSFAANGGISAGSGLGPILVTGAGGEVCAITTGSVDSSGSIAYAQF